MAVRSATGRRPELQLVVVGRRGDYVGRFQLDDEFEVRDVGLVRPVRVHLHLLRLLLRAHVSRQHHRSCRQHGRHQASRSLVYDVSKKNNRHCSRSFSFRSFVDGIRLIKTKHNTQLTTRACSGLQWRQIQMARRPKALVSTSGLEKIYFRKIVLKIFKKIFLYFEIF